MITALNVNPLSRGIRAGRWEGICDCAEERQQGLHMWCSALLVPLPRGRAQHTSEAKPHPRRASVPPGEGDAQCDVWDSCLGVKWDLILQGSDPLGWAARLSDR